MECECVSIEDQGKGVLLIKLKSVDKSNPNSFVTLTSDFLWKVFEVGKVYTLSVNEVEK